MIELLNDILTSLNNREREIIIKRFGLNGEEPEALEALGNKFGITRERVRQIQNNALEKVIKNLNNHPKIDKLLLETKNYLKPLGVKEEYLFYQILIESKIIKPEEKNFLKFVIIYHQKKLVDFYGGDETLKSFFSEHQELTALVRHLLRKIYFYFLEKNEVISEDELYHFLLKETKVHLKEKLTEQSFYDLIRLLRHLYRNPFKFWGLKTHPQIAPTSLKHKIYLILKNEGKPLHFLEIQQKLNFFAKLEDELLHHHWRKFYSTDSVLNELIRHPEFVLVGRGTYGLSEWGYEKGEIFELIKKFILEKKQTTFEELYRFITSQRIVKPTTISIYLYRLQKQGLIVIKNNLIQLANG